MWFYHKIKMWKRASGLDCKSESKNRNIPRHFKSHEQIELKRIFEKNHYPDKNIRNDLAQKMGVSKVQIQRWFAERRRRLKNYVSSLACAESGSDNFITSSTDDVNYPPVPFYSPAETMPRDHSHPHPQFQNRPDFFAMFSAMFSAGVCVCVCVVCVWERQNNNHCYLILFFYILCKSYFS